MAGSIARRDHGDGGIDARGPGRWLLRWRVGSKRFTKSVHGSISDARKELRRLIKSADDGQHVTPAGLTLATWIERWIALQRRADADQPRRGLVNARTLERYEELLRLHVIPTLGNSPLQRITATEIDELYAALERHLSTRTVHHIHTVLGACLSAAVRKGLLVARPGCRGRGASSRRERGGPGPRSRSANRATHRLPRFDALSDHRCSGIHRSS